MKNLLTALPLILLACKMSLCQVLLPPTKEVPRSIKSQQSAGLKVPKPKFNLIIVPDSACEVQIAFVSDKLAISTYKLKANEIKQLKVLTGTYRITAISPNPALFQFIENKQVSDQRTESVQITFKIKPVSPTSTKESPEEPDVVTTAPRYKDPIIEKICNDLVLVEGGSFKMGEDENNTKNGPAHTVSLLNFMISSREVTHAQFAYFVSKTKYVTDCQKGEGGFVSEGNRRKEVNFGYDASGGLRNVNDSSTHEPVLYVSWNDANAFCKWLTKETNREFQLPTEAQWEYAARGGKESRGLPFAGSGKPEEVAWHKENAGGKTHIVGDLKLKANELSLYDMSGNVWEWCRDWFDDKYYSESPENSPLGAKKGKKRVIRGGSWRSDAPQLKTTYRSSATPSEGFYSVGFRVITSNP